MITGQADRNGRRGHEGRGPRLYCQTLLADPVEHGRRSRRGSIRPGPRERGPAAGTGDPPGIRGDHRQSRPMERVFALARRVAPTDGTVLLTGESGTGKEMFVRAIHRLSRRKDYPLLACDCTPRPHAAGKRVVRPYEGSSAGPLPRSRGCSRRPTRARYSLTKWPTSAWKPRASCSACWRPSG